MVLLVFTSDSELLGAVNNSELLGAVNNSELLGAVYLFMVLLVFRTRSCWRLIRIFSW